MANKVGDFKEKLQALNACKEALEWVGERTPEQAWNDCHRLDWMFWLIERVGVDAKLATSVALKCARLVEHLMKDERSKNALDAVEAWLNGELTLRQLNDAANAYAAALAAALADAHDAHAAAVANAADAAARAYAHARAAAALAAALAAAAHADAYAAALAAAHARANAIDIIRETIKFEDIICLLEKKEE